MEFTMKQLLDAVPALSKLMTADLSLRHAHRLSIMADRLNTHLRFFKQRREAINGAEREEERLVELLEYLVELDISPLEIPVSEEIRLSAGDIPILRPFVQFYENEPAPKESEVEHV